MYSRSQGPAKKKIGFSPGGFYGVVCDMATHGLQMTDSFGISITLTQRQLQGKSKKLLLTALKDAGDEVVAMDGQT